MSVSRDEAVDGAQVERTLLAWNRSAIALAANGALLLRAGFLHQVLVLEGLGVAVAVAVAGIAVWALSLERYGRVAGRPVLHLFGRRSLAALAAFVLVLSVVDLAVVVFAR